MEKSEWVVYKRSRWPSIIIRNTSRGRTLWKIISREAESENASLVLQGMLMDFECRFLERKGWRILFDVSLYLDGAHIFDIHGNAKEPP